MDIKDVKRLAMLAQLDIPPEEEESLLHDLTSILGYIDQINTVQVETNENDPGIFRNVVREDIVTTVTGSYTTCMLASAPDSQDGFVKVTKIL